MALRIKAAPNIDRVDRSVGRVYGQPGATAAIENFYRTNVERPMLQDFKENVLPSISRQYGGNEFFSSERMKADRAASDDLLKNLTQSRSALHRQGALDEQQARAALANAITGRSGARVQGYAAEQSNRVGAEGIAADERTAAAQRQLERYMHAQEMALAQQRLQLDKELGRGRLGLDTELGRGRLGLDTELGRGQLGLGRDRLGLDRELGRGRLGLESDRLDLERELGRGRLDLDTILGTGRLGLEGDRLDLDRYLGDRRYDLEGDRLRLDEQLGTGRLGLDRELGLRGLDLNEQLGMGRLDLDDRLGTGRLDLERELGMARVDLDRDQFDLARELGLNQDRRAEESHPFDLVHTGIDIYNDLNVQQNLAVEQILKALGIPEFENIVEQGTVTESPFSGIASIIGSVLPSILGKSG